MQGLSSANSFIRKKLGNNITFKFVPEIMFIQDESLERGSRVIALMNNLGQENETKNAKKSIEKDKKRAER